LVVVLSVVLPLTLTLSHRERGPTEFASVAESHLIMAEDNRSVAVLNHGTESAPSPWGEGWGEGDTD
jgi:hypothetical protein